jgi:hypothetical protein
LESGIWNLEFVITIVLGIAALVALVVVAWRALQQHLAERARPGASPDGAIPVRDFGDIDFIIHQQNCSCGGRLSLRGEGPISGDRPTRVATLECLQCERERRIYFDLSELRH